MTKGMSLPLLLTLAGACCLPAASARAQEATTPEEALKRGQQLMKEGKLNRAAETYRGFLQAYPKHSQVTEAHWRLAKCLDALGWVEEVIPHLETVIKAGSRRYRSRPDALYMLGKLRAALKQYDKAAAALEKMLAEGAGLYEDEALNLCAGYYAVNKKYNEAAAKLNILSRRKSSRFAEQAAYKLCMLWLKAENLDLAVTAIGDLSTRFPRNKQAKSLMFQVADLFRRKRMFRQAVAACDQLRRRFPKSREAQGIGYILALCQKDQKRYDKAVQAFAEVARSPENRRNGLGAEALLQVASIYQRYLKQPEKAIPWYEETAKLAREFGGDRRTKILERCYFHLGEYHFRKKDWPNALENYSLLKALGTDVNVLSRIMKCQAELNVNLDTSTRSKADIEYLKKKIAENAGTFAAAEGEVFLVDLELKPLLRHADVAIRVVPKYQAILDGYSKEILAKHHLGTYIRVRMASCYLHGSKKIHQQTAVLIFEQALVGGEDSPYVDEILEGLAFVAEKAGDQHKAFKLYERLFERAARRIEKGEKGEDVHEKMSEYLKSMLTRAEEKDSIEEALAVSQRVVDNKGLFSLAAREAMFYMAELYYLKKDFSEAAKTYKNFVRIYGPRQNAAGDPADGPWKPKMSKDQLEQIEQVYEAAVRIAHCWYMQGHTQNMVKAYVWMNTNMPHRNKHLAEARYWLAMEFIKGKKGKDKASKRKAAELLWTGLVHPSLNFGTQEFAKLSFHPWIRNEDVAKYVKAAILKSGQLFSEIGDHQKSAAVFEHYVKIYKTPPSKWRNRAALDNMYRIANYALGREYIQLGETQKLIECYQLYLDVLRDDRFRCSALRLLGFHAYKSAAYEAAVDAYSVLLDEYGDNRIAKDGSVIPLPRKERVFRGPSRWNGVRQDPPKGLDLGQVRYALGLLYWKSEDWTQCVKTLSPFVHDPLLFDNKSRAKALYMVARSYYRSHAYEKALEALGSLIDDHPKFQAVEEAYVYAVRACAKTAKWTQLDVLYQVFLQTRAKSLHRPHMDLYGAVSALNQGKTENAVKQLRKIAESSTYQDVKANAWYYVAAHLMAAKTPDYQAALELLNKSINVYPQQISCLAAAKCRIALKQWEQAQDLLDRTIRDFPAGQRPMAEEAKRLLPTVLKEIVDTEL